MVIFIVDDYDCGDEQTSDDNKNGYDAAWFSFPTLSS